ncbi:putative uncharacterized protein [Pseudarthrobacter siccitolerans]|uniref:Gylcosyl hydrolase 115 C-terminal domain-containing protein n=1 Tax=Pseudarthrobacter siccitolerans TaxID=861266 RepID=A0A024GY98_9MICC|nr:glycosyl hydrolase 115 family protein [Pseudarthrobacter siccitolerans]CCQ44441.1 putative uncharacterized protein [Pseudarthrobacter siccitolerans]
MLTSSTTSTAPAAAPAPSPKASSYLSVDPDAGLTIAVAGGSLGISIADTEDSAVRRAAEDLGRDLGHVCGPLDITFEDARNARIVIGTIGQSAAIDAAIRSGKLDVSALKDEAGRLRWEGFLVSVVDDVLYLVGTDRRGTIYAIYDFAEAAGVSPWYWWGDVPVRTRDHLTLKPGTHIVDWPSVRYRGIFLNDEEELCHWARAHTADDTIGPETYARVYELILRLKGNYLWPAMHVGAFNHDPENGRLAHEMGVVIGTSHCDMLLRSNEHEFGPWVEQRGEHVEYDYSLTGRNRDLLKEYWRGSVEQNRGYEVTWTVGMRGVHDSGFETIAIDEDASLTEADKLRARVNLLEHVMRDQRSLLSEGLSLPPEAAPQLFIPYKEVLPLYDAGLEVPDDVTVVWANDSFGHIRRFPDPAERQRAGGHGLYYHSSYWSNYTTSYLATSSTPLALMKSELRKAWDEGIRQLWVNNIGGLKPLELEMEFFLRSAWEAGKEETTADISAFTAQWIDAKFSGGHGPQAGAIYAAYYQLNNQRKIEHLTTDVFPQVGYGDEASRRLGAIQKLYEETNAILTALPQDERDAFFQLFAIKIHMCYMTNAEFYHADRSSLAYRTGKGAAADRYLDVSRAFAGNIRALIHHYNKQMSGGRWDGMFTPHEFPPPVMPLHPAATPALSLREPGLGVTVWGATDPDSAPEIVFWPTGTDAKWIEVYNTGAGHIRFTVTAEPWIEIGAHPDAVATETRIPVRVANPDLHAGRTGTVQVRSVDTGETALISVRVMATKPVPHDFSGALEADGYVSIDPSQHDQTTLAQHSNWAVVQHLGRYGNAAIQTELPAVTTSCDLEAILEFGVHLETPGAHLLELHRLPTLNSTGRIRVGVSVDDYPVVVLESATTDEHRGSWSMTVQDNIEKLQIHLPWLTQGPHTLRLHAIDKFVAISKAVIYTTVPAASNLGPDFSTHAHRPGTRLEDPNPAAISPETVERAARNMYGIDPQAVAKPDQIYADRRFWDGPTTFRRPISIPQTQHGSPIETLTPQGTKDVIAAMGSGVIHEAGGVIAFEAEYALANSQDAWLTPGGHNRSASWTHTQAETSGGTGLAMHVQPRGTLWEDPLHAPGMHFALDVGSPGTYRVWLLVKFDDNQDDSCVIAVDGVPQQTSEQYSRGSLCAYGLRQRWVWVHLSNIDLTSGDHTFSIIARKSGLRVDRAYLTLGDELPPVDAHWVPNLRSILSAHPAQGR